MLLAVLAVVWAMGVAMRILTLTLALALALILALTLHPNTLAPSWHARG